MSIELKIPDLGENISSAGVLAVLVKPGDTVGPETPVLEIETDKATIEVPANLSGRVEKVLIQAGDKAEVGQVVMMLEAGTPAHTEAPPPVEAPAAPPPAAPAASAAAASSGEAPVLLPDLGENIKEAGVLQVLVQTGDRLNPDTPVVEIETDKATVEVPAGVSGEVLQVLVKPGDKAQVGKPLLLARITGAAAVAAEPPPQAAPQAAAAPVPARAPSNGTSKPMVPPQRSLRAVPASPSVRRLAREIGVDVQVVKGSGPRGRIRHEDVKAHARMLLKNPAKVAAAAAVPGPWRPALVELPDFTRFGKVEREAMTTIRRKTAENMAMAWASIPMVTQFDKADVTDLEKLRQKLDPKARQAGGKLTVTAILLKVCASALKKFPKFNASIDLAKQEVVYKKYFNVGVAVDTERGLLVPVVKGVEGKNIFELSAELQGLAERARNRKVTPDDLQGACFTITNLGGVGGTAFTPIVNPPEVAILGVSRSSVEPVWSDGQFVPRTLLPLSLSYDHRLIDGAEAARFLRFVCEALENPALLLFEG